MKDISREKLNSRLAQIFSSEWENLAKKSSSQEF